MNPDEIKKAIDYLKPIAQSATVGTYGDKLRFVINVLEKELPQKVEVAHDRHRYGHCPKCGRIYWDKCHVINYCDQCGQRLEVE